MFVQLKPLSERHGVQSAALALAIRSVPAVLKRYPASRRCRRTRRRFPAWARPAASPSRSRTSTTSACRRSTRSATRCSPQAKADPTLSQVRIPTILTGTYLVTKFNRSKALAFGVSPQAFFDTINATTGSTFVNFFDYGTRSYQVVVQAKRKQRTAPADLSRIYVANCGRSDDAGEPVPRDVDGAGQRHDHALQRIQRLRDRRHPGHQRELRATRSTRSSASSARTCPRAWDTSGAASRASKCRAARRRSRSSPWACCSCSSCSWRNTKASRRPSSSCWPCRSRCSARSAPSTSGASSRSLMHRRPLEAGRPSGADSDDVVGHLRADRLRHADRAGRQERDPDRRVRQSAARAGNGGRRGRRARRGDAPAARS